ncbi:MAG: hypothetical protein FWG05_03030, partial [Kiritimatiellaeota bacterium]|nr:hypothetical protein [Kiritimatiellota bacterium]
MSKRERVLLTAIFALSLAVIAMAVIIAVLVLVIDRIRTPKHVEAAEITECVKVGENVEVWRERYAAVSDMMPVFEKEKQADVYWINMMDIVASNGVQINSRKVLPETVLSGVYEIHIEVHYGATLETFTKFMNELLSQNAMLDIRELHMQTVSNRLGFFQGSFTLHCAYMRYDERG